MKLTAPPRDTRRAHDDSFHLEIAEDFRFGLEQRAIFN
jgi:hypothetical protein